MKKITFVVLLFTLSFFACDEEMPTEVIGTQPELYELKVPAKIYVTSSKTPIMSVRVVDPQGVTDIRQVTCEIAPVGSQTAVKMDTLNDSGINGDIIPGDGVFAQIIDPSFAVGKGGEYTFSFQAVDLAGHSFNKSVGPITLVDEKENEPPLLSNAQVPTVIDINATGEFIISVNVNDPDRLDDIQQVLCQIYHPEAPEIPNKVDTLRDSGQNGDTAPGDGIFSTKITNAFARKKVGVFSFRFQAVDQAQNQSNVLVKTVSVINTGNLPPVVSNLVAPDTLKIDPQRTVQARLELTVADPQGLSDVQSVFFNSFRPDGSASSGNPFYLSDAGDAASRDKVAGDGIYTLTINLPPTTSVGNYTFIFEAVDYSEAHSNQITHIIVIIK